MSTLFILGNKNQHTFANSIVAAHARAESTGDALSLILVVHSPDSEQVLNSSTEWKQHVKAQGVRLSVVSPITVDLEKGQPEEYRTFAGHLQRNLLGQDQRQRIYVDLTNGTSLYKSTLAVVAFILGIRDQFVLDVAQLPKGAGFLSKDALTDIYVQAPDPTLLDNLAPIWLTEIRRYQSVIQALGHQLTQIAKSRSAQVLVFEQEITAAVKNLLYGESSNKTIDLAVATRGAGVAFETFVHLLSASLSVDGDSDKRLVKQIERVSIALKPYSQGAADLFFRLATLLREARNEATHPGDVLPFPFQRVKARMSVELLRLLVEHTSAVQLAGALTPQSQPDRLPSTPCDTYRTIAEPEGIYYFGLDGDDTGRELERLFSSSSEPASFTRFSGQVERAIKAAAKYVRPAPISGRVLFCAGDDMLFRGAYSRIALERMRHEYREESGGHTCSIGFGPTPREAYVALKLAKARPGKDATVGIQLVVSSTEPEQESDSTTIR